MSQAASILAWLRQGRTLTELEALNRFGCLRLSGRILELRQAGYRIDAPFVRTATGKRVAQYRMGER